MSDWSLSDHIKSLGMTLEEYDEKRGNYKYLTKNGKRTNLHPDSIGAFGNPEVNAKAAATRKERAAEKKRRKEAAQTGFSLSVASDPHAQAAMVNKLWGWAMGDDMDMAKFAMKMLNDMGVIKQPTEKPTDEEQAQQKVEIQPNDAIAILKAASIKSLEDLDDDSEDEDDQG